MIAAVNGVCAGGGLHFVADADIVIAAADATFLDPHVSIGQVTAYEAIALVRKSPMEPIVRMALTGRHERITADRARQLGILSEVVDPPERLRERAQELAETIARNSPAAMAATKRALWGALELGLTDACRPGRQRARGDVGPPGPDRGPARLHRRDANPDGRRTPVTFESLKVERHGPVGWLINNRPDQLNAMNSPMRDELADAWKRARRRPRGAGDRPHRRGAGLPDRASTWPRSPATASAWSATAGVGGGLRPPLHRLAPGGVEAGHHRGERHLRRRWRSTGSPTPTS